MPLAFHMMPLIGTVLLLLSRRVSLLNAGVVGMLLALTTMVAVQPSYDVAVERVALKAAESAWLAWHAMSIIATGLLFHRAFEARPRPAESSALENRRRSVFVACFLVGPFAESVTGFGVGLVVALAMLRRMDLPPVHAAALGLFSQVLAPWGAMGVGTRVGAELIGVPFAELGTASALLMAVVLPCLLPVFWRLIHQAGLTSSLADRATDLAQIAGLAALIWATNRFAAPELGGGLATAIMLLLVEGPRLLRGAGEVRRRLERLWPYVLLVSGLLAMRLVPPFSDWSGTWLVLDPFGGLAPLALLRHPATWLALVAALLLATLPGNRLQLAGGALRSALLPMAATLVFVELAGFMAASGGAAMLAQAWQDVAGGFAVLATPLLGAAAGALTGSNTASNALMMHIQLSLAAGGGVPPMLAAATQTVSGSLCTMLNPARIVLAANLVGTGKAEEATIYRLALPIGLVAILAPFIVIILARAIG